VPSMAKPVPTFSTVAAVLGVSDGGNRLSDPRAVLIHQENTSGTQ